MRNIALVRSVSTWSGEECNADDSEVDELLSRGDGGPGRPRDNCLVTEVTHWHHLKEVNYESKYSIGEVKTEVLKNGLIA